MTNHKFLKPKLMTEAESERHALLQMFQCGFLDGYNANAFRTNRFNGTIKKKCIKAFEKRFMTKIKVEVEKIQNGK